VSPQYLSITQIQGGYMRQIRNSGVTAVHLKIDHVILKISRETKNG
jgi:hypothetical protein